MKIRRATLQDLAELAVLFDGYRQFYQQASDLDGAKDFLSARLSNKESVIFVGEMSDTKLAGFVQLYPSFTSVGMKTIWVLNDLFVAKDCRQQKWGEALMKEAMAFARSSGARNLSLQTAQTNLSAQRLYEKLGWRRDEKYYTYTFFPTETSS